MPETFCLYPRRTAVIPDGQRRYADRQGIDLLTSYERGANRVEEIINWTQRSIRDGAFCMELLAFWSGSEDNLTKRPGDEVAILQEIYSRFLQRLASCMDKSDKRDVRFLHIGRSDRFSPEISRLIREIAKHTRNREGLKVVLALDYGGREDRWQAIRAYAQQWWKPWEWGKSWLDYTYLGQQGVSAAPFDYVIRTGAKSPYLSHFADTYGVHEEQFHTEYFPDYTVEMFADDVLNDYPCRRQRRGA